MPAILRYSLVAIFMLGLLLVPFTKTSMSIETMPPHSPELNNSITCASCHTFSDALGPSSTKYANDNLCLSCHKSGGLASASPFTSSDQAKPGIDNGTSHSWSGTMPAADNTSNQYGLRSAASLTLNKDTRRGTTPLKTSLTKFGGTVACSTCHNIHTHWGSTWDQGHETKGTATSGSTTTLTDSSKNWATNQFADNKTYLVFSAVYGGLNGGQYRLITSNTSTTLTVAAFGNTIPAGAKYFISKNRRFLRVDNAANEMCNDCHYYRTAASGQATQTNVRTWNNGLKKSHPVSVPLVGGTTYNSVPLEPAAASFAAQTGSRYASNGGTDNNTSNNMVFDNSTGTPKISCMTCHKVHFADSDSATNDAP
ncbi:MAG: hypothetical protein HQL10_00670 [Nitrospirae bacterium]|nr:hypothetical protein [Nitrospirota bacterium]